MTSNSTDIDQARFREVLGHFASGLTVITALLDGVPVGFTCQSFASLSLEPPMVVFAPGKTSTTWPQIREAATFCINILEASQESLARSFAASGADKFAGVGWSHSPVGAPALDGALAWIDCELGPIYDAGDHELVVGAVRDLRVGSGSPLLFYRGGFGDFAA